MVEPEIFTLSIFKHLSWLVLICIFLQIRYVNLSRVHLDWFLPALILPIPNLTLNEAVDQKSKSLKTAEKSTFLDFEKLFHVMQWLGHSWKSRSQQIQRTKPAAEYLSIKREPSWKSMYLIGKMKAGPITIPTCLKNFK